MPIIIQNGKRVVVPSKNELFDQVLLQAILDAIETTGADSATNTKIDELIVAVNNISGVSSYNYVQKDTSDSTYIYYGFASGSGWQIKRKTIATALWEIASGSGDYATEWLDRANKAYNYA